MPPVELVRTTPSIDAAERPRFQPRGEVIRAFVDELPPRLRPTPQSHRLQVALVWGDDVLLDVRELAPGEKVTIGSTPDATLQVFHPATQRAPLPIVEARENGEFLLFLPAEARSTVRLEGVDFTIVQLLESGRGRGVHLPVEGVALTAGLHDRAILEFGQVRVIARQTLPSGRRWTWKPDLAFWSRLVIYGLIAATLGAMSFLPAYDDRVELGAPAFVYAAPEDGSRFSERHD